MHPLQKYCASKFKKLYYPYISNEKFFVQNFLLQKWHRVQCEDLCHFNRLFYKVSLSVGFSRVQILILAIVWPLTAEFCRFRDSIVKVKVRYGFVSVVTFISTSFS